MKVVYNARYGGFSLSVEACTWLSERAKKSVGPYDYAEAHCRIDRLLVECVETLGEEANGMCADLRIIDVSHRFRIDDYDGYEAVVTDGTEYDWVYVS